MDNEKSYMKPLDVKDNIIPDLIIEYPSLSNEELRSHDEEIISLLKSLIFPQVRFINETFSWIMRTENDEVKIKYLSEIFKPGRDFYYFDKEKLSEISNFINKLSDSDINNFTNETSSQHAKLRKLIEEFHSQ